MKDAYLPCDVDCTGIQLNIIDKFQNKSLHLVHQFHLEEFFWAEYVMIRTLRNGRSSHVLSASVCPGHYQYSFVHASQ
jgi:hypothetical protein